MPHWTCHYYRLETRSSFVVGSWEFSRIDSVLIMAVYTVLILLNLTSVVWTRSRLVASNSSGLAHLGFGAFHIVRLLRPCRFEVFGFPWSRGSSTREVAIEVGFGTVCL